MATKCINKNTIFYKALVEHGFDANELAQITDKIDSTEFEVWYGKGERDTFGQPRLIKDLYLVNDKGESITINDLLNDDFYTRRQNYSADLTHLDKINKFLEDAKIGITRRISAYRGTNYAEDLENLLEDLDKIDKNDFTKALDKHAEYITETLEKFELRFYKHDKVNEAKLTDAQIKDRVKKHKEFLVHANNFLQTFSKVKNLDLPLNRESKEYEIIEKVRGLENRVVSLQHRVNAETEAVIRDVLSDVISNPEVKAGVIDFLAAQADENIFQLFLDALGDSHVTFAAAIDKFYKRAMFNKDEEKKEITKEWNKIVGENKSDFDAFLERVFERDANGDFTGKFVQEYSKDYYDTLFNYRGRLRAIKDTHSKEYYDLNSEYYKWRKDNTEQRFVKQYYEDLSLLTYEAIEAKEEIDDLKHKILTKGVDKLTIDDFEQLQKLEGRMNQLKSTVSEKGVLKTGKELELANSISKYSKTMSKYYETTAIDQKSFEKARKEAEKRGPEYLSEWMKYNTVETFTDGFWDWFNKEIISKFPSKSKEIIEVEDQIKRLLITFRNDENEVKPQDLPNDIRKKYDALESKKRALRKEAMSQLDLVEREKVMKLFQKHLEFVPTSEYLKMYAEYRQDLEDGKITQDAYDKWFHENHDSNFYTGEITPKSIWTIMRPRNAKFITRKPNNKWKISNIKQEFLNPNHKLSDDGFPVPTDKFKNAKYSALTPADANRLKEIQKILLYLTEHTKGDIIKRGFLPAIPKNSSPYKKEEYTDKAITESGEIVRFIPFRYVKELNQKALPELGSGATVEENQKIEEERKRIIEENRKSHAQAVNYDLDNTVRKFIDVALTHKYKSDIETDIKLFQEQMKHQKIKQTDAKGRPIFDKIAGAVKGTLVEHEKDAKGSNVQTHFEQWLEAVFYEDFEKDEGWLTQFADHMQTFTSLRNLGFNVLSTINNKMIGNIQATLEAAGGRYFNVKDYKNARWEYFTHITHFIANHKKKTATNYYDGFLKKFDILISQEELANRPDGILKTAMLKLRALKDSAFIGLHIGEHQIQNTTLLAMAKSHRVVDGKIVNFSEFWENGQIKINYTRKMTDAEMQQAFKDMEVNYKLRDTLEKQFKEYPSVFEAFNLQNGYLQVKEDIKLDEDAIFNFRERVLGINQRMHGIYNIEDAALIQRWALGRLGMQFRKWLRPSWNKRFGRRFGKKDYSERIRDYEEGVYVSMFKFVSSPFKESWKEIRQEEKRIAYAAFATTFEGFKDLISNYKLRWHSMSEMEKANVKKAGLEFLFLISVIAIGFTLKSIKDDDDDKAMSLALYQADRLFGELSTFTPIGVVREGNRLFDSPLAVFNTLGDVIKLGGAILAYPFRDEEERVFKSGIYHGEDKINIYSKDILPVYTQWQKLVYLNDNTQRYGMFR